MRYNVTSVALATRLTYMVFYGLVACQFVGIFTAIRYVDYDHIKRGVRGVLHLQRNKRT